MIYFHSPVTNAPVTLKVQDYSTVLEPKRKIRSLYRLFILVSFVVWCTDRLEGVGGVLLGSNI